MSRAVMILAGLIMLIGAIGWVIYGAAPGLCMEILYFEIVANGPTPPESISQVAPAVGFASLFGFGIVAYCIGLAFGDSRRRLATSGFAMLILCGVLTIGLSAVSFMSVSSLTQTFTAIAQSSTSPTADEVRPTTESAAATLQTAAWGAVPSALFAIAAALFGTQLSAPIQKSGVRIVAAGLGVLIGIAMIGAVYRAASGGHELTGMFKGPTLKPAELAEDLFAILGGTHLLCLCLATLGALILVSAHLARNGSSSSANVSLTESASA